MGSFIGEGCISKMPIYCSERIGALLVIQRDGDIPVPVAPIIWGKYDDYGGIEPDDSRNCEIISDIFGGLPIKDILDAFERITHNCDYEDPTGKIKETISKFPAPIYLVLEHESILKEIINYKGDENWDKSKTPKWFSKLFDKQRDKYLEYLSNRLQENQNLNSDNDSKLKIAFDYEFNAAYIKENDYYVFPVRSNLCDRGIYCVNFEIFSYPLNFLYTEFNRHTDLASLELKENYCESLALWSTLLKNHIFIYVQRYAGWQSPSPDEIWKKLTNAYRKVNITQNKRWES